LASELLPFSLLLHGVFAFSVFVLCKYVLSATLQEMPPTPSKDADVQVAPQLHIPFVGYQDGSDSEASDHHVIFNGYVN
jgi:hypothetical protein